MAHDSARTLPFVFFILTTFGCSRPEPAGASSGSCAPCPPCPSASSPAPSSAPSPSDDTSAAAPEDSSGLTEADVRVRIEPTSGRTTVFDLPFPAVDVVAGAAPSSEFPAGTLVFAVSIKEGFKLVEWDPAHRRAVREATYPHQPGPDNVQVGNTYALARTGSGFAYVTTGYEDPSPIELWIVGRDFAKKHHRVIDIWSWDARRCALHASGETLALSYCAKRQHHLVTFDVSSGNVLGKRTVGRGVSLCLGYTTPLADVRVVGSEVWSVGSGQEDYEVMAFDRGLRRILRRYPIPTPGLEPDVRKGLIVSGTFPRFDVSASRIVWNTAGELRMSSASGDTVLWKDRVDPASISKGLWPGPQEMDFPIAMDPDSGAALLGDGTWYAPDGAAARVFRTHEEQPDFAPIPVLHRRRVLFAHGRGVFLGVSAERATLALVEPR